MKIDYLLLAVVCIGTTIYAINSNFIVIRGILYAPNIEYLKTEGEIIKSGVKRGYKWSNQYNIVYAYWVSGKLYTSTSVDFLGGSSDIKKYTSEYPVGKKVLVFYESDKPNFSVLKPTEKSFRIFLLPLFFLVCSLGALYKAFK